MTGMMAIGAMTVCIIGVYHEHIVIGGSGGGLGCNGDDANNAAGTKDAEPPIVAVTSVHLDA